MSPRRSALVAGALYLLTFAAIPTLSLYSAIKTPGHILGPAGDGPARAAALLEVIVALACIGTAVVLYPMIRRAAPTRALGFVMSRTLEAAMIFVGVGVMLTLIGMHGASGATGAGEHGLVSAYDASFLLGQSLMPGINALLLGTVLYQTRLIPRLIPLIGLIGAPIHLAAVLATLLGVIEPLSPLTVIGAAPIALWEFSLGVYLVVKGFRAEAVVGEAI